MASLNTTFVAPFVFSSFTQLTTVKLDGNKYLQWLSQLIPIMRSRDMMGIVDSSKACPTTLISGAQEKEIFNSNYTLWINKDQFLFGWIHMTLFE